MTIHHSIDKQSGIMLVKSRGPQVAADAERAVRQLRAEARENAISRFLIDMREADIRDTIAESYLFAGSLDDFGVRRSDKLAILVNPQIPEQQSRQLFSETVAVNRGFNFRVFGDETEAIKWLSE